MNNEPRIPSRTPHDLSNKGQIKFRHPGYLGPTNILLLLAKADCEDRNGTIVFGLHHKTALLACQIIANNAFHLGYFTLDSAGSQRVNVPLDGLLTDYEYYFFIPGIGLLFICLFSTIAYAKLLLEQYPIVPSFRDWRFPHNDVDNIWPTTPSDAGRPSGCPLSGCTYAINGAHLIPREEATWYRKNAMGIYADINDPVNIIPLRKDLHKCFNDRWFVIIPKPAPSGVHYVTHILSSEAAEIWPSYHNIEMHYLSNTNIKQFLFARFAWAIIQGVKPFITAGIQRKIIQVDVAQTGENTYKEGNMEGSKLQDSYARGGSRSATPLKRKLLRASENDNLEELSSDDSSMDVDMFWDFEVRRSGKRQMHSSDDTVLDIVPPLPKHIQEELEASAADLVNSQNLEEVDE